MNNAGSKLEAVTIGVLGLLSVSLLMNTCAVDRLEKQVIRQTKALEVMTAGGGGTRMSTAKVPVPGDAATTGVPGSPTGLEATGWGGKIAPILHVEGAVPNAPLTLSQKPRPQNDTYVNRRSSPPGSLNYYATNEGDAGTISRFVLGRLIDINYDNPSEVTPSLAVRWEVADDKLTYTYHLRRGVQFADGRPFTAADVKFTFDVMRDPEVRAEHIRGSFDDVESLETPDPYTVVVKYRKKYWKGIYSVGYTLRILNRGWYEEQIPVWAKKQGVSAFATEPGKPGFGDVFNKIRTLCPGTGPYYIEGEDYNQEKPVDLAQNPFNYGIQVTPEYWNFKKLRWIFISDDIAAFEEFRKQKFDVSVVDFQPMDDEYSKDPTITNIANYFEYDHMGLAHSYITWNTRRPPFDDVRVRRAMTHLTNRDWIVKEIERGRGQVANCPSKPSYATYCHDAKPLAFDLKEAARLLAEAGWKDTDGDGVLDKNGKRFEFELKAGSPRRFYTQVAAVMEDACKKLGIRMSSRTIEWSTFIEDLNERRFDGAILYASYVDPWIDNYESFHSSQDVPRGENTSGWRNPKVDKLLEDMREEFDDQKRAAMFQEFNKIFMEEQPQTLLVHGVVGVLQNKRFQDVKVRPTGMQFFDIWVKPEDVLNK